MRVRLTFLHDKILKKRQVQKMRLMPISTLVASAHYHLSNNLPKQYLCLAINLGTLLHKLYRFNFHALIQRRFCR